MVLERGTQRALIAAYFAVLAALYIFAWHTPALGMYHDDAVYLGSAKALAAGRGYVIDSLPHSVPQTKYPPLWPLVLAPFTLVSLNPQWLKLVPLLATIGWLFLLHKLLRRLGASAESALFLIALTAAAPMVVFLATNLMSEALFALLCTWCLLMLIDDRPALAGLLAGLATLTRSAGVALIAACIITFTLRRRFRHGLIFTGVAVLITAPWFGWTLAHSSSDAYYSAANYSTLNIITGLAANEKFTVLWKNTLYLLASPYALLTGYSNLFAVFGMITVFVWSLIVRRQTIPDVFVAIYCCMVLCWAWPPDRFIVPILPFLLWIVWRAFRLVPSKEALAAATVIALAVPLWGSIRRIPATREGGVFASTDKASNNWKELEKLFAAIRADTPPDAVLAGNLDPVLYLYTGRKAIRGFTDNGYQVFYSPKQSLITPDQFLDSIRNQGVSYVVLSPDRDFAEAPLFHKAIDALERGGVLEPVTIPGLSKDYRLLHVVRDSLN